MQNFLPRLELQKRAKDVWQAIDEMSAKSANDCLDEIMVPQMILM
jgi:hypothetical protein